VQPTTMRGAAFTSATHDPDDAGASLVTEVLEALLEADETATVLSAAQLVERIPAPDAEVEAAIGLLVAQDVATLAPDGVTLSPEGRKQAVTAVRQHRLTERLLADVIGLEWWKVHHEAERWEGVLSEEVEQRLVEVLGDPGTCPHGNPIPGSANRPTHPDAVLLADAPLGPVHIVRITEWLEADDEALQLLQACGFVPGRDAEIIARQHGWVEVAGTIHDAALPPHVAVNTYVAPR